MTVILDPATGKPLTDEQRKKLVQLARGLKPGDEIISINGHITTTQIWQAVIDDVKRVSTENAERREREREREQEPQIARSIGGHPAGALITVPLTDAECLALSDLSRVKDLAPDRVMIQALRLYQLVTMGGAEVITPQAEPKWRPITDKDLDDLRPF